MSETYYMVVTKDEYELPLAVARSPSELARYSACDANAPNAVSKALYRGSAGYVRFTVEDDDDAKD